MAFFRFNYVADCVKDAMDLLVVVPQKKHIRCAASPDLQLGSFQRHYPVLLLLHDEASSPRELCGMTGVERFAEEHGVMVVMPQGLLSYYTDYADRDASDNTGGPGNSSIEANFTEMRYEAFLLDALRYVRCALPASRERGKTFVGGIGMGGFGAIKLAMKHPEVFSAVFSIAGDVDLQSLMDCEPERKEQFEAIFGAQCAKGENNLPARCAEMAHRAEAPRLMQLWAKDGARAEMNRRLAESLVEYPNYRAEEAACPFDWDYVDNALRCAIAWL